MTKSLVTGGAGFIGSNLIDELLKSGHEVVCVDNESSCNRSFHWNKDCENHKFDICNSEAMMPLFKGVDYVFHLAAESRIASTIENPDRTVKTNVLGTQVVLECAKKNGVRRFVYSSTSSAYGKNPTPHKETQNDDPLNPYSVSKVAGEKLCSMYTSLFGLETIILRYFNVYGKREPQKGHYAPVIGKFIRQKQEGEALTIVGDGMQRRDFTNVSDVTNANLISATKDLKEGLGTVFNIGSGKNYSILDIANMISDKHIFLPSRIGEMHETLADNKKSMEILGWVAKVELKDYLK